MTEIQFLLDIILDTKTITEVRRKCKERICEVESKLIPSQAIRAQPITNQGAQYASTQAPLNTVPLPIVPASQRIVGGEVDTGNGTKGPRKF